MTTKSKARAIFTNDAECDDMNSMLHMLLYANDIDIEGIVLSSSIFHYAGDPERGIEPKRWAGGDWMWEYLDAYEQVWPNLVKHDPAYPSAEALRSVTCIGNVKTTGDMDEDTDGSELIRHATRGHSTCLPAAAPTPSPERSSTSRTSIAAPTSGSACIGTCAPRPSST